MMLSGRRCSFTLNPFIFHCRYGREDEEVMGLKFCNEAVIALKQIWPKVNYDEELITPLQVGIKAIPFIF